MSHIRHEVSFTGKVEAYRPIWRRNMILLILTVGLSFPWALVSRLRYFYQHTQVAGGSLDYHASAFKMFVGNVVATVILNIIYYGISLSGPYQMMGVAAMQILTAALLPVFMHGFLEFQLQHTSWRGQRLDLDATPADAIKAMGLPTLLYIVGGVLAVWAVISGMGGERGLSYVLGALATLALCTALPWFYVQYKRYQHRHAALGSWRNERPVSLHPADATHVTLRTAALAFLALMAVVLPLIWGLSDLVGLDWATVARLKQADHHAETIQLALVVGPGIYLGFVLMMGLPYPYLSVQLQNRLWSETVHDQVRFESKVPVGDLVKMTARNWALIAGTLGWYYPKAAIEEAKFRMQSVAVWLKPGAVPEGQGKVGQVQAR